MIALALLASHLVGDFVFQTRWQANGKLDDSWLRTKHVAAYQLAFVPVVLAFWPGWANAVGFLSMLGLFHYATDSRRFYSTLGDVLAWWGLDPVEQRTLWEEQVGGDGFEREMRVPLDWESWPPPNPWPAIPLMIDQTLHVAQLAALGWLLV